MIKPSKYKIADKQKAFDPICWALFALLQINLAGCVLPIPTIPEKAPFSADSTSSLKTGITSKETVKAILGEPSATRQNDSVYIYANPQQIGWLLPFLPGGFEPWAVDWNRNHLLIIQFTNDGIVKEINHIVGAGSQREDGIYVADPGLRPKRHEGRDYVDPPFDRLLILYAPHDMDERAKMFLVPPKRSAIYFFRHQYSMFLLQARALITGDVYLDNAELGDFGDEGYFYWIVDPGVHDIRVSARDPSVNPGHLSMACEEGRAYFIGSSQEFVG